MTGVQTCALPILSMGTQIKHVFLPILINVVYCPMALRIQILVATMKAQELKAH